ncbi:uncharacterized protein PAC_11695 [Phialocephala subalpina]|uniref:Uncharacterized protein n=1 Tax=Phialocephala subalpina TaxID=576137 RepID=A0A1L7X9S8_9HELO|nr:uncharacterized protein PAC_11695 [Phialocephala subalpina]
MAGEGATMMSSPSITSPNQQLFLLDLPQDILTGVCGSAWRHSAPIETVRSLVHTSKFGLKKPDQEDDQNPVHHAIHPALTAFTLELACKTLYNTVNRDNLFYKCNAFYFPTHQQYVDYVKALPTQRRNVLQQVKLLCDPLETLNPSLAILASLKSLRFLELDIRLMGSNFAINGFDEFKASVSALRGLKCLTLTRTDEPGGALGLKLLCTILRNRWVAVTVASLNALRLELVCLATDMSEMVTLPLAPSSVPLPPDLESTKLPGRPRTFRSGHPITFYRRDFNGNFLFQVLWTGPDIKLLPTGVLLSTHGPLSTLYRGLLTTIDEAHPQAMSPEVNDPQLTITQNIR